MTEKNIFHVAKRNDHWIVVDTSGAIHGSYREQAEALMAANIARAAVSEDTAEDKTLPDVPLRERGFGVR